MSRERVGRRGEGRGLNGAQTPTAEPSARPAHTPASLAPRRVGAALVRLREQAGLTVAGVARASQLTAEALRSWEQGEASPRLDELRRWLSAVGSDLPGFVDELLELRDLSTQAAMAELSHQLGTRIHVRGSLRGGGDVRIELESGEQLVRLYALLREGAAWPRRQAAFRDRLIGVAASLRGLSREMGLDWSRFREAMGFESKTPLGRARRQPPQVSGGGEIFNRELVVRRFSRGDWVPSLDEEEPSVSVCRRGAAYQVSRAGEEVALFENYSFACVVAAALVSLDVESDLRFAHPALKLRRQDGGHTRLGEFTRLSPREKAAIRVARWIAGSPRALAWVLSAASPQCLEAAEILICNGIHNTAQETAEGFREMR